MGPLHDTRIIEIAGLGACPFGCMVLADLGADVLRVDRIVPSWPQASHLNRNKRSIAIDLKSPAGVDILLRLADGADVLAEGLRPGVAERLGFGPQVCLDRNPRLVYARMTGWGQEGPLAGTAGHDIDYIAISGALHLAGPPSGPPVPQANLVGDFGGGGMLMAVGVLAALLERGSSGAGQVVDAAMVDGSALLTTLIHELMAAGQWSTARGRNLLDGGAPWYGVYETADGKYLAIGALEERFYDILTGLLDLPDLPSRDSPDSWPELRERFAAAFKRRTRAQWLEIFDGTDACVAPVLSPAEAPSHPHNAGRFARVGDAIQPSPAPRFSRTPAGPPSAPVGSGTDTDMVLASLGYDGAEISKLRANGVVGLGDMVGLGDDDHNTEAGGAAQAAGRPG